MKTQEFKCLLLYIYANVGYTYLDDNDILAQLQSLKFNENVGKGNE